MIAPAAQNMDLLKRVARSAMLARGLLPDFSSAALAQARSVTAAATAGGAEVRDLRGLLWASIDNDDSRDLDQLSVSETLPAGAVRILIAIADVDAIVRRNSPIDVHARANTTSVYTVPQIFPMLPENLSTDLTSLAQDQDRIAIITEMTVEADGTLGACALYRAWVRNRAKLAYNGVAAWLTGTGPAPARIASVAGLDAQLRVQDAVAQALKAIRHVHGALTLESTDALPVFDGLTLSDLRPGEKNRAQELIEDFMIAANGVTARYLASQGLPTLRRVLKTPKNWVRIVALAAQCGEILPAEPSASALNVFLTKRRELDPSHFADMSLSVIKLLGRGQYLLELPGQKTEGHFGLAVSDYTHATAPNRRFPDLLTQRLLKASLGGVAIEYSADELQELAAHCTKQEDNAAKVERQVSKSAAAMLLAPRIGESFDAIVTGAADKGTWARITSPTAEGKVVSGFAGLQVGDPVRVKLVETNIERGFIDFERLR